MFIKRKILSILEKYLKEPEVLVLTGFRRVGKTTIIKHIFDRLPTDNKIFLDMESPVNQRLFQEVNYETIAAGLKKLGLVLKTQKAYVFLDEIQFVKTLPSAVKYLFDHYRIKFVLTGSSSFYLKNLFSESLAGRKFLFELYPLDFEEFLWFKGEKLSLDADYDRLRFLYDEYLEYGGLPGVVLGKDNENKKFRLDDALGSYFQLDVANLASFRDNKNLKSLLFLLAPRAGNKLDITKLSQVLEVSRQTMYNYLEFLEKTYLIHLVPPYSSSPDVIVRRVPKIYFCDSGLLNRVGQVSLGQLFENAVFNQLYIKHYFQNPKTVLEPRVTYFQKKSGAEIDFIVKKTGYETKLTGTSNDVSRLRRFTAQLKLDDYSIISLEKTHAKDNKIAYPFNLSISITPLRCDITD